MVTHDRKNQLKRITLSKLAALVEVEIPDHGIEVNGIEESAIVVALIRATAATLRNQIRRYK